MDDKKTFLSFTKLFLDGHTEEELHTWVKELCSNDSPVNTPFKIAESPKIKNAKGHLFYLYPMFETHFKILLENGYITQTNEKLKWEKSIKCLAEYFAGIDSVDERPHWKDLENIFSVKNLYQTYNNISNVGYGSSKDYEKLKKILFEPNFYQKI